MKKIFIGFMVMVVSAVVAMAGEYTTIQLSQNNITTNSSSSEESVTYAQRVTGLLKRIIIDNSGVSTNANVEIVATSSGALGYARTLFSSDNGTVLTDGNYPLGELKYLPNLSACTNDYTDGIELYNEQIQLVTSGALATNVNVKAWLIIENK